MESPDDKAGSPGESRDRKAPVAAGADIIIPVMSVALALYFIGSTTGLAREARLTGWMIGFILIGLCVVQIALMAARLKRGTITLHLGEIVENTQNNRRRLALVGLMVLFVATIGVVGTATGLFLSILSGLWVMGVRKPSQLLGIAGGTAATVFVVFMLLLDSRLPRGAVENFLLPLLSGVGG